MPSGVICDVWLADVAWERPAHLALLDDVERQRRAAYRMDADRARFTVAAALLRLVVAAELGTAANEVRVDRTCARCAAPHGKPRIPGTDLHGSITHSGDKVAFALTRSGPVGVDVERISTRDVDQLAPAVLAADEPLRRPEDFFTYWCRKEAVVKATGDGVRVPLREVVVSAPDLPARLLTYQGATLPANLRDLPVGEGYRAALAVLADGTLDVRMHDAAAILSSTTGRPAR